MRLPEHPGRVVHEDGLRGGVAEDAAGPALCPSV